MIDYDSIRKQLDKDKVVKVSSENKVDSQTGEKKTVYSVSPVEKIKKTSYPKGTTLTDMNASKGGSNPLGNQNKDSGKKEWSIGELFNTAGEGVYVGVQQGIKGAAKAAAATGAKIKNWDYESNPNYQDRAITLKTYDLHDDGTTYAQRQAAREKQREEDTDKWLGKIDEVITDDKAIAFQEKMNNADGVTRVVGEVAQGVGGMIPSIAASAVAGPAAGLGIMALSAGGNSFDEARKAGATFDEAYTYGVLSGATEVATEKMFGGVKFLGDGFVKNLPGVSKVVSSVGDVSSKLIAKNADNVLGKFMANSATKALLETAKDAAGEGMEEFVSGLVDPYLRRATFDPNASSAELSDLVDQALVGGLTAVVMNGITSVPSNMKKIRSTKEYNSEVQKRADSANALASIIPMDIRPNPLVVTEHTSLDDVISYANNLNEIISENMGRISKEASMVSEIGGDSTGTLSDVIARDESSARMMFGDSTVDQYMAQRDNMIRNGYTEDAAIPVSETELDNTIMAEEAMKKYQDAVEQAKVLYGTEELTDEMKENFKREWNIDYDALKSSVEDEISNLDLSPTTRFKKLLESDFSTARRVYGNDVVDRYIAMQGTYRMGDNSVFTIDGKNVDRQGAIAEMRKRFPQATEEALISMYNDAYTELVSEERKANPEKFKKLEDYERTANLRLKNIGLKLEVRYDMNNTEEAFYDPSSQTIVLNGNIIHSTELASYVTAHELTHYAVKADTAFLQDIRLAAKSIGYDLEAGKKRRAGAYSESEIEEEAIADFIAQITSDASIIEQMVESRPSILERIVSYLKETLTLQKHDRVTRAQKREVVRRLNKALEGKPVPDTVEKKVESAVQNQVEEERADVKTETQTVEEETSSKQEKKNLRKDINKMAATLEQEHRILMSNSKLTRRGISNNLDAAVQMIQAGEEEAARNLIENLAYEMNGGDLKKKITAGVSVDESSSLRRDLKNVTLHVTPEMKSEWADYNEFRKGALNVVRLSQKSGREVDIVYDELRDLYPWLPDVSNPADQVNALIECASVNEEITGWDDERMKDVDKLTEKILSDLHTLTGVKLTSNEYESSVDIPYSKSTLYKYSLTPYDEHQKENWRDSKRIVIFENDEQALQFVNHAISGNGNKKLYFGKIPSNLAKHIFDITGVDVDGYNCSISESEIRKILLNSHGDNDFEKLRGKRSVLPIDIVRIPEVIQNPDDIRIGRNQINGNPTIHFIKEIDGKETIVTYVSDKHKDLSVQTMYIGIKKGSLATPTDDQASIYTPEASRGTASVDSVSQSNGESKIKKSLSPVNTWGNKLSTGQQEYFKDSKVTDESGKLIPLYHGTMSDFYVFDRTKGNKSGNMGAGFYFTNNEEDVWKHYATPEGPDLKQKIDLMAERLMDIEDMPEEEAYAQARAQFIKRTEPRLIEAYVNITKPVVIGGDHSTFFDFDSGEVYDAETDSYDYGEQSGLLVDFLYSLENVLEDYDSYQPDIESMVSDMYYEAYEDGGISAYDLTQMVRFRMNDVTDPETGDYAVGEVIRQAFEDMGFDGIIDHTVSEKFKGMNLDQDTTHYIAFHPEQAKEISNMNPTQNADIRYSKSPVEMEDEISNLRDLVSSIRDDMIMADEVTYKRLQNQLVKYQKELDDLISEEQNSTVKTPINTILQNLSMYRRSDLESLAEQMSEGAWDGYEELSRKELEDGIRSIIEEREYSPLELQSLRFGYWVRPVEQMADIQYSKEIDWTKMEELWEKYQKEYGVKERTQEVPEKINEETRVSDFMESAYMAAEGNEEMQNRLKSRIVTGEGSYVPMTDKTAMRGAERKIARGFNSALEGWNNNVDGTKPLKKEDIALGELLLKTAMDSGDINTAEKLVADLCVEANRAGQVLQAFSMLNKLSAEGRVYYIERNIKKLQMDLEDRRGDNAPTLKVDQELLDKLTKATTLEEADAIQEEIIKDIALQIPPSISDRVVAWRYLAMLGNARTHIRNIASNAVMQVAVRTKDTVAGTIEGVLSNTVAPNMERTTTVALPDQDAKNFASVQWDEMKNQMSMGGKNGFNDIIQRYKKNFGDSAVGKVLNKLDEMNGGALENEDTFFKGISFRRSFAKYMAANHLTSEFLSSGTKEANSRLAQARAYATNEAMKSVFQDSSFIASKLNEIENKNTVSKIIVGGMMPFKKTPINILKRGVEYSPIGILNGISMAVNQSSSGSEAIHSIASGLTGSSLMLLGCYMASIGIIRAGGDDDEKTKEKYYNEMLGQQDYAITIGDTTYTIDWVTPVSMPLMAGVEFYNAWNKVNGDETAEEVMSRLFESVLKTADPLTQLSMLSGLNDSLDRFGDTNKISAAALNAAESYVTQFFPTIGGQIARTGDNTRRTTYVPNDEPLKGAKEIGNKIQAKTLPGGLKIGDSQIVEPLEPYIDQWGRTQNYGDDLFTRMFNQTVAPWYAKKVNRTSVDDELTQLFDRVGDTTVLPSSPMRYYKDSNENTVYVSAKDYTELQESAGQLKYAALNSLFNSNVYKSSDDEEKMKLISDVYKYADNAAKSDWANKNNLDVSVDSIVDKIDSIVDTGVDVGSAFAIRAQLSAIGGEDTKEQRISLLNSYSNLSAQQKHALLNSVYPYKEMPW